MAHSFVVWGLVKEQEPHMVGQETQAMNDSRILCLTSFLDFLRHPLGCGILCQLRAAPGVYPPGTFFPYLHPLF